MDVSTWLTSCHARRSGVRCANSEPSLSVEMFTYSCAYSFSWRLTSKCVGRSQEMHHGQRAYLGVSHVCTRPLRHQTRVTYKLTCVGGILLEALGGNVEFLSIHSVTESCKVKPYHSYPFDFSVRLTGTLWRLKVVRWAKEWRTMEGAQVDVYKVWINLTCWFWNHFLFFPC